MSFPCPVVHKTTNEATITPQNQTKSPCLICAIKHCRMSSSSSAPERRVPVRPPHRQFLGGYRVETISWAIGNRHEITNYFSVQGIRAGGLEVEAFVLGAAADVRFWEKNDIVILFGGAPTQNGAGSCFGNFSFAFKVFPWFVQRPFL